MAGITKKQARLIANKELEKLNRLIRDTKEEPDYTVGDEKYWYWMAEGYRDALMDFNLLTSSDCESLRKKISEARRNYSEIKLLGQR